MAASLGPATAACSRSEWTTSRAWFGRTAAGRELSLQPGRHAVHGRGTRARNGGGVDGEADETDHLGRGAHFVPNKNKTIFCEDVSNSLYRVI